MPHKQQPTSNSTHPSHIACWPVNQQSFNFHALAKDELVFTRGSKGCLSIQTSSSRETNTLKFAEVWNSEDDFNTYFAKKVERSSEDFARLLLGPPEKECFQTDDWGYEKGCKNN
jgi:quinol monooxygenase YgiN